MRDCCYLLHSSVINWKLIYIIRGDEKMKETQKNIPLAIATVVLGIVVGFSSLILSAILDLTEHYFLNFNETNKIPVNINIFPIHRFV